MEFFPLIYQGVLLVFFLTFSMGPAFFTLMNLSLTLPRKKSRMFATGIIFSDILVCFLCICIIHFGMEEWIKHFKYKKFIGILSGCVLIFIGGMMLKSVSSNEKGGIRNVYFQSFSMRALFYKGFFLNFLNPSVWLMWLGNVTLAGNIFNLSVWKTSSFFLMILGSAFGVEMLKIQMASRIKRMISPLFLKTLHFLTGMALLGFGVFLIYSFYFEKFFL